MISTGLPYAPGGSSLPGVPWPPRSALLDRAYYQGLTLQESAVDLELPLHMVQAQLCTAVAELHGALEGGGKG